MPKTIIFVNGLADNLETLRAQIAPDDTIICVDGGTAHALALGLKPTCIIGDLDSLAPDILAQMEGQNVPILRHPVKKDETDLELALHWAIKQGAKQILLVTALGGRLDQHLANILLLTRPEWATARVGLLEGHQTAWLLRGADTLKVQGQKGDTLSVVPLSRRITGP